MNIIEIYKKTENKEHREWFLLTTIMLLGMFFLISLPIFFEYGTRVYYKANGGLFIIDIMVFIIFIGGRQKTKDIISDIKRMYIDKEMLTLSQYGDVLLLIVYLTAILSFVFVLDLSFISNYGIKVGAVVSVTFAKLIKDLFWSRK